MCCQRAVRRRSPRWWNSTSRRSERGESVLHPVEARIEHLANGYWLLVGADTSERINVLRRFGLATAWGIALTALCVWLLGAAYARRTARRVRDYATTCETIMQGDLTQRLRVDGSRDEFDALAVAVNAMLDRIEQQTTTLRTAFDSIAHDLRTPLYRLRVRLEEAQLRAGLPTRSARAHRAGARGARPRAAHARDAAADRARRGQRRHHARRTGGSRRARGQHGGAVCAGHARRGPRGDARCAGSRALLTGNRQLLAQLITNLLENALKYVPAGGHVQVSVRNTPDGVSLSVADDGPGIAAAERAAALRPFVRVGDAAAQASGSGLGLTWRRRSRGCIARSSRSATTRPGSSCIASFLPPPGATRQPAPHRSGETPPVGHRRVAPGAAWNS